LLQEYDAVVICNGHNSEPSLPNIKGMKVFPGFQIHSHNYREPDQFADQVWTMLSDAIFAPTCPTLNMK
jgi:cation diffusion facilitator CzcD-associated flavoprotein CzcO